MTDNDLKLWADHIRNGNKKIKIFVHKKCDQKYLNGCLFGTKIQKSGECADGEAHIISMNGTVVAYRIKDTIWVIPATVKAVVNNNDGKLNFYFDYPCEMKEEDLVEL